MVTKSVENDVTKVIRHLSRSKVAKLCGVTWQAVHKWYIKGRLPRTEFTSETDYAQTLADEVDGTFVPNITRESLLQATREAL